MDIGLLSHLTKDVLFLFCFLVFWFDSLLHGNVASFWVTSWFSRVGLPCEFYRTLKLLSKKVMEYGNGNFVGKQVSELTL